MSAWQETEFGRIPSHWDYLRIENTDLQIGDGNYSSKYPRASELLAEGIPFISSTDLSDGKISADNLRYISTEHHSRLLKGHIKQGDVLIVVRGNGVGQVGLVSEEYEDANLNAQMAYLGRSNKIDGAFLYYLLSKYYSDGVTETVVSGSAQPQITVSGLKQLSLIVPPIDEQKSIAAVLSSLDDKIDLLHRQNKTLEAMAETLFRQWFVEEAQEDWGALTLAEVISVKGGTTPSTKEPEYWDGTIRWSTPRDLSSHDSVYLFDTERKITDKGLAQIGSGLLPVGTVLLSSRAPIGYLAIADIPVAINQGYIAIVCDKLVSNFFMYLWCLANMDEIKSAGNGSTFEEISKSNFKALPLNMPPKGKLMEFDKVVAPTFEKIKTNQKQIRTLEKLRDNLLPKLMSGEVRVEV